ncbi:hypothetical protein AAHE18_04G228700 [Arachis hypogaea]
MRGFINICFKNIHSLQYLSLGNNRLQGTIISEICKIKQLSELYITENKLISGEVPTCFGNLTSLRKLYLNSNKLSKVPSSLWSLRDILEVNLSDNALTLSLPIKIGNLKAVTFLDLSKNMISGSIPGAISGFLISLTDLDLSQNNLFGLIPRSLELLHYLEFINLSHNSLEGEIPSGGPFKNFTAQSFMFNKALCGNVRLQVPTCSKVKKKGSNANIFFIKCILPIMVSIILVVLCVFFLVRPMRNLHHRNLMKIIGCCSSIDYKLLVMEFMPNGSLERWLYSHNHCLDFLQRLNIMIDVASALEYLHHGSSPIVVHCDVKPCNVLLDEDIVGHVNDFGIAKLLGERQSKEYTKIMATVGYIAPEFGSKGIISIKGDVYSFGIMLMETFTRKKPTDDLFVAGLSMKGWISESLSRAIDRVVDSNLLQDEGHHHVDDIIASTSSILKLALNCCEDLPEERMNMDDITASLNKVKAKVYIFLH